MTPLDKKVLRALPIGKAYTKRTTDIAKSLGISERTAREVINRLIVRHGVPICGEREGDNKGIYIARTDSERLAGLRALHRQQEQENKRITALMLADLTAWKTLLKEEETENGT